MNDIDSLKSYTVSVTKQGEGLRLDKFLSQALPDLTRSRIQQLLDEGCVTADRQPISGASKKVKEGQTFEIVIPPVVDPVPQAENIPLDIVYEDEDVIVINKPAGMVVHPGAGNPDKTLVNALLAHCGDSLSGINGVKRPGIVHRLDKGTTGLLVVAKNDKAHQALTQQLADRSMSRIYQAVVWGVPSPKKGEIEGTIGRNPKNRKKMALVRRGGKEAKTHYKVLKTFGMVASLVECQLETGRTHQIRVHLTSLGHSLIGDPLYGRVPKRLPEDLVSFLKSQEWPAERPALHAIGQKFIHPGTDRLMEFTVDIPGDIRALLNMLDYSSKKVT